MYIIRIADGESIPLALIGDMSPKKSSCFFTPSHTYIYPVFKLVYRGILNLFVARSTRLLEIWITKSSLTKVNREGGGVDASAYRYKNCILARQVRLKAKFNLHRN